jgi:hypothetical protein
MARLLENEDVKDMDVLAIREPARNLMNRNSYNTRFHPEARTCFYVNKRVDPDNWGDGVPGGRLMLIMNPDQEDPKQC